MKNDNGFTLIELVAVIAILALVTLVAAPNIANMMRKNETKEKNLYDDVLKDAAERYYINNGNRLPNFIIGETIFIQLRRLVDESLITDGSFIEKIDNSYSLDRFMKLTRLNDGTLDISVATTNPTYFYLSLIAPTNVVSSKTVSGLHKINSIKTEKSNTDSYYYYSGPSEEVNNWVVFDNKMWRIVKINSNGSMEIILVDNSAGLSGPYDQESSRPFGEYTFNNDYEEQMTSYLNQINESSLKELLTRWYLASYPTKFTSVIDTKNICIGKIGEDLRDAASLATEECSTLSKRPEKISSIRVSDLVLASTDASCVSLGGSGCRSKNYLVDGSNPYLSVTASYGDSSIVYDSNLTKHIASASLSVRPVITLKNSLLSTGGSGTRLDPYIIY